MASKKVTKSDLVQKVFENSNFTKKEIQSVTDELINQIKKSGKIFSPDFFIFIAFFISLPICELQGLNAT